MFKKFLDARWVALLVLCLGDLMIVLDTTIVNVALPSIQTDLHFTADSLVWVINAYMLTYSGFLLLGGRLGDLYGHRTLFCVGLAVFTIASLACGFVDSEILLIVARAIQGIGGAIVSAIALSLIMNIFTIETERAEAMGFYGFVMAGGGSIGVFLGGLLTGSFNWHWVFLVNIPIGLGVLIATLYLLPASRNEQASRHLDIVGAILITASLILSVYAIVNGNTVGWLSVQTLSSLALSALLFASFVFTEKRVQAPLVPFSIFRFKNITSVSIIGILWSAGMFAWFFLSALFMQLILGYTPLQIGLAFLPSNLIMAAFSLGLSAKLVMRFGVKVNLAAGMLCIAIGLFIFSIAPLDANFIVFILLPMLVMGLGAGLAFNPVLLAGTAGVPQEESGLVSGVLNTAFMMGGSLGLAILASSAAWVTETSLQAGVSTPLALLNGYHTAFFIGGIFSLIATFIAMFYIKEISPTHTQAH